MVLTNSTKQMRTTKGTFNAVLSRVQIDGNSCADIEGSQNHARINRGVRIMRGYRGESKSCEDLEGSQNHALIERGVSRRRGPETSKKINLLPFT